MRENIKESIPAGDWQGHIWLRAKIADGKEVTAEFSYSMDGVNYLVRKLPFGKIIRSL